MTTEMTITEARAALAAALDARVIPTAQLARAASVAAHFGHGWAVALRMSPVYSQPLPAEGLSIATVREIARAYEPEAIQIEAPSLDDRGVVYHETDRRRFRWEIDPDGDVRVWVQRPDPESYILVTADEDGVLVETAGELEARHFDDAICAVAAVGIDTETATVIVNEAREFYISRLVAIETEKIRERVCGPVQEAGILEPIEVPDSTL